MPDLRPSAAARAALAGGFCMIVLCTMLVQHAWPLMTGEACYLRVRPVDPRDLFRGDYVVLGYDINQILVRPGAEPLTDEGTTTIPPSEELWDALVESGRGDPGFRTWRDEVLYLQLEATVSDLAGVPAIHRAVSIGTAPVEGRINLKGRARTIWREAASDPIGSVHMTMHYGIDAFFVQEGTGKGIEDAMRGGEVHAVLAVTSSGRARLRDLVIDGRRWSDRVSGGEAAPPD